MAALHTVYEGARLQYAHTIIGDVQLCTCAPHTARKSTITAESTHHTCSPLPFTHTIHTCMQRTNDVGALCYLSATLLRTFNTPGEVTLLALVNTALQPTSEGKPHELNILQLAWCTKQLRTSAYSANRCVVHSRNVIILLINHAYTTHTKTYVISTPTQCKAYCTAVLGYFYQQLM